MPATLIRPSIHPSIHPSTHSSIRPSLPPIHHHSYHIAIVAALLLFPSPLPPHPPFACLPLYTLKDYHFCCCFCCILSISPLLLLLLHFSFHVVGLFAVKSLPTFFSFLAIYQVLGITIRYSPDALLLLPLLLLCLDCFLFLSGGIVISCYHRLFFLFYFLFSGFCFGMCAFSLFGFMSFS
jgi:hypothetical protein